MSASFSYSYSIVTVREFEDLESPTLQRPWNYCEILGAREAGLGKKEEEANFWIASSLLSGG